ncbi:MAG: hypothetical protein L6Q99_00945 [Planctomycetes bacterium]|nr:hypothetical protein [Planctomycetota bacterium]
MSSRRSLRSPWFWLVPTLACALGGLYWLEGERTPVGHVLPTVASPDEDVAGFAARVDVGRGAVRVRLTPLHPDATRQRFDASALARRLALDAGEPWRLTLAFDAAPSAAGPGTQSAGAQSAGAQNASAQNAGAPNGDAPNADAANAPLEFELSRLAVVDSFGGSAAAIALAPLASGSGAADRPSDPLRVLLGATHVELAPGRSLDVFLWGRRPGDGARLVGLSALGGEAAVPLEKALHRRAELEAPLARLDRPTQATGKSAEPRASEAPRR